MRLMVVLGLLLSGVALVASRLAAEEKSSEGWVQLFNGKDLRLAAEEKSSEGWVQLFNGKDLTGWKMHPDNQGDWAVVDGFLVGKGKTSHIFSERGDYENFVYRIEARINANGNSGQYFRAAFGPSWPKGYEAQINVNPKGDRIKTGSLYPAFRGNLTEEDKKKLLVLEPLHKPDEWFVQEVTAIGPKITIKVNGKTTMEFEDSTYKKGHFALQQHDPSSFVQFRKIEVKELPSK